MAARLAEDSLGRRLLRTMLRSVERYDLIRQGDHLLVAVSGGKDSFTMLDLLPARAGAAPIQFQITAVPWTRGSPAMTGAAATLAGGPRGAGSCEDTYSIVKELTAEGGTYAHRARACVAASHSAAGATGLQQDRARSSPR